MSIMWADDFNSYGDNAALLLNGLYAQVVYSGLPIDPDPNASGRVYQSTSNSAAGTLLRRVFPSSQETVGMAFRLWTDQLPDVQDKGPLLSFRNAANQSIVTVGVTTTGAIRIRDGAGIVAETDGPVVTANAWAHWEFKAHADATAGSCELCINGFSVLTAEGRNFGTEFSQFSFENGNNFGAIITFYVKDLIAWNGSGGHNNDFLGTVSVIGLTTDSDVTLGGWTPSTGTTGYNLLDNSPPLDGTQYLTGPYPPPLPAEFGLTDLPLNVSSVRALLTQVRARKKDGGDGKLQSSLVSNGDEVGGADRAITTAFTYYVDVFETDPHTLASWTPAGADNAQFKINRTL